MNVKVTTPTTETSGQQLRTSQFAKVGIWLAAAWLPIDWKYGLNLGQLGFAATFFLAPIGLFFWCQRPGPYSRRSREWSHLGALDADAGRPRNRLCVLPPRHSLNPQSP
jgi:hypothetical protein